jgi:hypothetical protein
MNMDGRKVRQYDGAVYAGGKREATPTPPPSDPAPTWITIPHYRQHVIHTTPGTYTMIVRWHASVTTVLCYDNFSLVRQVGVQYVPHITFDLLNIPASSGRQQYVIDGTVDATWFPSNVLDGHVPTYHISQITSTVTW